MTDACENIDFVMSLFTPSDVEASIADRYQMATMLANTTKPIVYITMGDETANADAVAMAEAVAGGERQLRERPFVACYKNTLFPLVHNREAVRTLLDLAGKGLPCIYSPVSTAGTVAPMTVAGSTVVVNAGVLAGLVMAQLKREGAPYIAIGWAGEAMDMRTMVDVFAWPDHRGVYSSLLHWYGLPLWTLGGVTDSKLPDQQAAAETALTLMADAVIGGHINHNIGFIESAFTGSLTQVVLGDDIAGWIKAFVAPVDLSDEALGLDVIDEVGPGGLFLKHKHTRRHARDRFQPADLRPQHLRGLAAARRQGRHGRGRRARGRAAGDPPAGAAARERPGGSRRRRGARPGPRAPRVRGDGDMTTEERIPTRLGDGEALRGRQAGRQPLGPVGRADDARGERRPGARTDLPRLKDEGLRDSVKVMVGGAPVTAAYADEIGADGYGANAGMAVARAKELAG